ncbi:unnamed protein product [Parnassius apollo]|uniref:(apollo) hypothetical protein n=1 Tax=Parnassius apollo TaxID=110799 RepID=A0A8S3XSZ3_PARAO|nr:unnamed protein product [Parnassius apollo]
MQNSSRKILDRNKNKETVKDDVPGSSRKAQEERLKKNVSTPRNYLQKTTPSDIYDKKKPNVLQAPKKAASSLSTHTNKIVSPMKDLLKSSQSSVSNISSARSSTKMAVEKRIEAKANMPSSKKSTPRTVKAPPPFNVTVNSPVSKRKSSIDLNKEKCNSNTDNKISKVTDASVDEDQGKNKMADIFLRQRSKTRTLDENEVKILKPEVIDNNAEMKNLSRRLSAKPMSFYVDLSNEQEKVEKEKSSEEEEVTYEDDFESYESDFDSYHSGTSSEKNSSATDEDQNDAEIENSNLVTEDENSTKDVKDEEKMLDSGSYDLRDPQRSTQKVKPAALDFILEGSEDTDKKPSLTDEGFQEMSSSSTVSSMKPVHIDVLDRPLFIDFTISKENKRKRRILQQLKQRAQDILSMISLHEMTYMLFELAPIPYDLYMATYGKGNCTQIAVQTFDDGITEEVQTEEISYDNKWTQLPVKFSKHEVYLNANIVNSKEHDEFLKKISMLVNQKIEDRHDEQCEDKNYRDNPLRIFLEQKDGVGSDVILPLETYRIKLKQHDFNAYRLKKFLKKVERRISSSLSMNTGNSDMSNLIKSFKFPFSKGYITVPTKNVSADISNVRGLKITNAIFSTTRTNLLITVHEKSSSPVLIQKCILCMWDLSVAMQDPLKLLIATDNVTIGRFKGGTDGIVVAALRDGTIHLWDLSEEATWMQDDTSEYKSTNSGKIDTDRLSQTELDRQWNLKNRSVTCEKKSSLMQTSAYTSSGNCIVNSDVFDCIVGLEFLGDSQIRTDQDGGRKIIAQMCSLQRAGILTLWSIAQEKPKSKANDIGKAFWSKLSLEKAQTIHLTEHLDLCATNTLENSFTDTFNLNAAKRRISIRRQDRSLLRPSSSRVNSAVGLYCDNSRPRSATSARNRNTLQIRKNNQNMWETGLVCNDLKIIRINNADNFLIAKNCGEVLCCTRFAGTFKVNKLCVANDTSSITCLEVSKNGLPYILAATETGLLHLCSIQDYRVVLTLDCRNETSNAFEKCKADNKGRYISSVTTNPISSSVIDFGKEKKMSVKCLVWSRTNPFDMFALLHDGAVCAWRLTSSDINARRVDDAAAVCVSSGDTMAIVTCQNEVQVHRLCNEQQEKDNVNDLCYKIVIFLIATMRVRVLVLLSVLAAVSSVSGYHILCMFPIPSRSHSLLAKGIVNVLLEAGHQVTWVTPYLEKSSHKNLKQIEVSTARDISASHDITKNPLMGMEMVRDFGRNISLAAASFPAVREALVKEKYDAVISEWFFSDIEAGYAAVQQVPWIMLSGVVMHPYLEYLVDTIRSLPVAPFMMNDFAAPMSFWDRLQNTFSFGVMMFSFWRGTARTSSIYEQHFAPLAAARGVPLPPFSEAMHNISVLFVNSHPSFTPAISLPSNVIEIAGYHINEITPPLPKDLQEILDASPRGVVYFSLGSVLKSSSLHEETKRDLLKVLGELPYTVLWKFEEKLDGLPKNVHIRPWMPQTSILAHPNVKVFITHGGLLSTLESLRYGVPIIAIPAFGDQPGNAARSVRAGHALKVKFSPDMAPELKTALNEMLSNDSYYKKAKSISKLFNNRPVKQSKLILHYIELAIESKGAYHLRSKALLHKWYELWMLDQLAAVLAVLFIFYVIVKKIICAIVKKLTTDSKTKKDKKNK